MSKDVMWKVLFMRFARIELGCKSQNWGTLMIILSINLQNLATWALPILLPLRQQEVSFVVGIQHFSPFRIKVVTWDLWQSKNTGGLVMDTLEFFVSTPRITCQKELSALSRLSRSFLNGDAAIILFFGTLTQFSRAQRDGTLMVMVQLLMNWLI